MCDVGVHSWLSELINFEAARPRWVTLNEGSGISLPTSVSGRITSFLTFMWDQAHVAVQHNVAQGLLQRHLPCSFWTPKHNSRIFKIVHLHPCSVKPQCDLYKNVCSDKQHCHCVRTPELVKVKVDILGSPVPNSPYGLCGRKATLNSNTAQSPGAVWQSRWPSWVSYPWWSIQSLWP